MTTLITRTIATLITLSAVVGCAGAPVTAPVANAPTQTVLQPTANAVVSDVISANVGAGQTTPATISLRLDLGRLKGYSLQASSAGTAAKTTDDLVSVKFYLIESVTGTPPTALTGSGFEYNVNATNRATGFVDVTFTNVAANNSGKSYYVAAAAFTTGGASNYANITNLDAPISDADEGHYYVSTSGGSPSGAVRVTPTTYAISGTMALGVPLQLLDAVTPVIDSRINLTVGDEITGAPGASAN